MTKEKLLKKSVEHVQYEWTMFSVITNTLIKGITDQLVLNVFLESFAIHARNLEFIEKKANKQVSHLTYHRTKYNSRTKPWPFHKIYMRLDKTMDAFIHSLPIDRKNWFTK